MESPPAAVAPCSAALASSKGRSVSRAARTRACAARFALSSATRATGAAFTMVCVAHVQSGLANFNATAWISQQQWSGRWPVFLQTPPRVAPASARFLPLIIRFPWAISLHFFQAWSLAPNWSCWFMLLLGWPRAHLHGCGMPGALSNSRAQRATLQQAAPAVARAPHACRPPCRTPPFTCRLRAASAAPRAEPAAAVIPWRPRLCLRACDTCPCLPCNCIPHGLAVQRKSTRNRTEIVWASRAAPAESPREALTYATEIITEKQIEKQTEKRTETPSGGGATRRGRLPRWVSKCALAPLHPHTPVEADLSPLIRWGSSKRTPLPSADSHTFITTITDPTAWNRLRPCGVELRLRHCQPLAGGG